MAKINGLKIGIGLSNSAQDLAREVKYSQAALAERLQISPRQLRRILKQDGDPAQGASANWLFNLRMEDARNLLKKGLSVKAVAYEVGFSTPHNFSRAFRRAFGMSPKRFLAGRENN